MIGNGVRYVENVRSSIEAFFIAPVGTKINIGLDVALDSEPPGPTIPRAWLCASIVSIDKKDGDPLNPGDKRDIALINIGLKLVCKVLQMRIERFVETNNLLSYEQAGFRSASAKSVLDK
ncbi:hypothetical protein BASA83_013225 [Batrachochytrium salamandrivorans]|nr:hypothetical protein BASA83_013225 [Batrachochytrium salamandrivorans]